jgi:DNA-binding MarR family transcriptional regulator
MQIDGAGDLADEVLQQVFQAMRDVSKGVNIALADCDVYSSEWAVIKTLKKRGEMTQIELARHLNVEPAAISKTLAKLVNKEIVEKHDGNDRREKHVYLTPRADKKYLQLAVLAAHHRREVFKNISEEECQQVIKTLQKISKNADEYNHDH